MTKTLMLAGAAALTLMANSANAITITETLDFPLFTPTGHAVLPPFDLGQNTISGHIFGLCVSGNCFAAPLNASDPSDAVQITVGSGQRITGFTTTIPFADHQFGFEYTVSIADGSGTMLSETFPLDGNVGVSDAFVGLGAGTYDLTTFAQGTIEDGSWELFYVHEITVESIAAVPVPASALMLGLGLAGLGAMRRRERKLV